MKSNFFIAVCITITIALFFAWSQRWSDGPEQTIKDQDTNIVLKHKKDNWANESWTVLYGIDGKSNYYGLEKPASQDKDPAKIEKTRDQLTYAWWGLSLLFIFLSILGLLNKLFSLKGNIENKAGIARKPGIERRLSN